MWVAKLPVMTPDLVRAIAAGLLLCVAAGASADSEALSGSAALEQSVRQAMDIPADTPFEYQDRNGQLMDPEAFAAAAEKQGNTTRVDKSQPGKVVLRVARPRANAYTSPTHLPALEARDLSGRPVRNVDLGGKPTLLSFYFSTCVPCIQEVPALNAFREAHPELNYLAITFDHAADARKFVSDRKLSWPVVAGAGRFLNAAGVRSFPGYMMVAPDGRIMGRGAGLTLDTTEETPGLAALEKFVGTQLKTLQ